MQGLNGVRKHLGIRSKAYPQNNADGKTCAGIVTKGTFTLKTKKTTYYLYCGGANEILQQKENTT